MFRVKFQDAREFRVNRDEGGIDFIQVVVGLLIIGIACVGTLQALTFGYDHLKFQMRYRQAVALGRAYMEYWQGRIHTDFDPLDMVARAGNLSNPVQMLLDEGDPTTDADDIYCWVSYGPLIPIDQSETGIGVDYWEIRVYVKWWERYQPKRDIPYEIALFGTAVPASL
ncbi:MAG: hypothetical protein ACK4OO_06185 [bacterium]